MMIIIDNFILYNMAAMVHTQATVYGRLRHVVPWKVKKQKKDGPI